MNAKEFQRLVKERPDLGRYFHYVRSGGHIKEGYYKRIPRTYRDRWARPPSQLRTHIAFGEAAQSVYGKRGLTEKGQPLVTDPIKKAMEGKKFRKSKWEVAIEKLTAAMKEVVEVTAKTET